MKLASIDNGKRDGQLVVVSRDLSRMCSAADVAPTLQAALDDWSLAAPQLQALADKLEQGAVEFTPFSAQECRAPLARAYQWLDGSAYLNHVELTRRARGGEMPPSFLTDPVMYRALRTTSWLLAIPSLPPAKSWAWTWKLKLW